MKSLVVISHSFGAHVVFDETSVDLPDRGVVALRGPNGCGKTTLLKLLGGVISSSCAEVERWRKDVMAVYLDADFLTLGYLTVEEHLKMVAPLTRPFDPQHNDTVQLLTDRMMSTTVADLSLGQRQRLVLTIALALRNVDVLLLDEPLNGLDQQASLLARDLILAAGTVRLVLVATHEGEQWTDYDLTVHDGRLTLNAVGVRG